MKKYKVNRENSKKYKEYWLKLGYSEEEAIKNAKYEYSIKNPTTKVYWLNKGYTLEQAELEIRKRKKVSKEYWIANGYSEEAAINIATRIAKTKCKNSKEYWIAKGYSEEEAIKNANNSNIGIKCAHQMFSRKQNRFCKEYWIEKGFSESESIQLAKNENKNTTKNISFDTRSMASKIGQANMSIEVKLQKNKTISQKLKAKNKTHSPIFKEYWIAKGYSEEEAIKQVQLTKLSQPGQLARASKIELRFFNDLQQFLNIAITLQKWVSINKKNYCQDGRYQNIVIEFNGTAFHMDKRFYTKHDKNPKNVDFDIVWKKNNEKIKAYQSKKYNIIIVWEYDYLNNKEKLFDYIKEIIINEKSNKEGSYWDSASIFNKC